MDIPEVPAMTPNTHGEADGASKLDEIFRALSHPARRRVLIKVGEHNPREGDELENEELLESVEEGEQRHLELYHNHLPSLDASDFINWDPESDTITRGPRYEEIRPIIQLMEKHQDELPDDWP